MNSNYVKKHGCSRGDAVLNNYRYIYLYFTSYGDVQEKLF